MPVSEGVAMRRHDDGRRRDAARRAGVAPTPGAGLRGPLAAGAADAQVGPDGTLRRDLLRDAVFARLVHRILRGEYRPGQRLRLDDVAAELGVSRTPVREALVPLEALRLVLVQRYVGVVIAPWSPEHMIERMQIAQTLLAVPFPASAVPARVADVGAFDAGELRSCRSEAGRFTVLAEWTLRRLGRPVSADWLGAQRAVLDAFYARDVACRHGLDMTLGAADRAGALASALGAVWDDDVVAAVRFLDAFADAIAELDRPMRRRPPA